MVGEVSGGVEEAQRGSRHVLKVSSRPPAREGCIRRTNTPPVFSALPREEPSRVAEEPPRRNGLPPWVPLALSAGGGAAVGILIVSLL